MVALGQKEPTALFPCLFSLLFWSLKVSENLTLGPPVRTNGHPVPSVRRLIGAAVHPAPGGSTDGDGRGYPASEIPQLFAEIDVAGGTDRQWGFPSTLPVQTGWVGRLHGVRDVGLVG